MHKSSKILIRTNNKFWHYNHVMLINNSISVNISVFGLFTFTEFGKQQLKQYYFVLMI